jgi:hypothetical protein
MATRRGSSSAVGSARTNTKTAGKPATESATRARKVASPPSEEELDLRDRLKAGPRRPAGPPLVGDTQSRSAMNALRNEVLPEPTDPRNRRGRK